MPVKSKKDPKIDKYIKGAPTFAKPVLNHLRQIVRQSCPQVEETIKWGKPWYMYNGKVLCGTVAFKAHVAFIFNKWSSVVEGSGKQTKLDLKQMRRISTLKELPSSALLKSYVKQAMKFNEPGAKIKRVVRQKKPPVKTPPDLMLALRGTPKAGKAYETLIPSIKRHYIEWILDAKTEETREARLEKAVECIAAGKIRHWK